MDLAVSAILFLWSEDGIRVSTPAFSTAVFFVSSCPGFCAEEEEEEEEEDKEVDGGNGTQFRDA